MRFMVICTLLPVITSPFIFGWCLNHIQNTWSAIGIAFVSVVIVEMVSILLILYIASNSKTFDRWLTPKSMEN